MSALDNVLAAPPIPAHPTTPPMPFVPEVLFTVFLGIPVVVMVFFAVRHLIVGKGPLLLFCLIGGGIACLFEPIVDTLGCAISARARSRRRSPRWGATFRCSSTSSTSGTSAAWPTWHFASIRRE